MAKIETDQVPSPPKPTKTVAPDGKPKNRFNIVLIKPAIIKGKKYDVDDVAVLEAKDRGVVDELLKSKVIEEYSMVV